MLLKHKDGDYSKAYVHEDGTVTRWYSHKNFEAALLEGNIVVHRNSLPDLLSDGWEIVPPTFETLTMGDVVKSFHGEEYSILTADGCGKFRMYLIGTYSNPHGYYTAVSLKYSGFTIPTQSYQSPVKQMTVSEVSKLVGQPVKIVEG